MEILIQYLGGYEKFIKEGYYNKWLPTWLQEAGYQTYFTGKLMNAHNIHNYQDRLTELDLDGHDFMIEPGKAASSRLSPCSYPRWFSHSLPF